MMHEDLSRDPWRDPELEGALRELGPEPPLDAVDWAGLQRRVGARARLLLARRRRTWWDYAGSWARPAIPATLAASLALLVLLHRSPAPSEHVAVAAAEPGVEDVLEAAALEVPYGGLTFTGDPDALLEAAVLWEGGS